MPPGRLVHRKMGGPLPFCGLTLKRVTTPVWYRQNLGAPQQRNSQLGYREAATGPPWDSGRHNRINPYYGKFTQVFVKYSRPLLSKTRRVPQRRSNSGHTMGALNTFCCSRIHRYERGLLGAETRQALRRPNEKGGLSGRPPFAMCSAPVRLVSRRAAKPRPLGNPHRHECPGPNGRQLTPRNHNLQL